MEECHTEYPEATRSLRRELAADGAARCSAVPAGVRIRVDAVSGPQSCIHFQTGQRVLRMLIQPN